MIIGGKTTHRAIPDMVRPLVWRGFSIYVGSACRIAAGMMKIEGLCTSGGGFVPLRRRTYVVDIVSNKSLY